MQFIFFDYGWNMLILVFCALIQTISWFIWSIIHKNKLHKYKINVFNILLLIAGLLEIFDFPPILGIFDAHSIWHGLTTPLAYLLYDFLLIESENFNNKFL